jgi:hypothetical protein
MGYDIHITRANDWAKAKSVPILLEEWLALIQADPEMRLDGFAEAEIPEGVLRYEHRGLAVWKAYSGNGVGGNMAWFDYVDGRITVKNPDKEIIAKMKQIAKMLGARVVGDEDEEY